MDAKNINVHRARLADRPASDLRGAALKLRAAFPADDFKRAVAWWLEEVANQMDAPPCNSPDGVCNGCERREDFNDAYRVAKVVLGRPTRVPDPYPIPHGPQFQTGEPLL